MEIYQALEDCRSKQKQAILTIGNFDGVHLGHKALISTVVDNARNSNFSSFVLTFRNHPLEIIKGDLEIKVICTPEHKIKLLEELGFDALFNLPFTKEFSQQDPETFLNKLKKHINYKKIILGHDARIGRGREGDKQSVIELSKKMGFEVQYLDPVLLEGKPISSSIIRQLISSGDFKNAKRYLGRPYSILSKVIKGNGLGTKLDFPTANINVSGLILPPNGIYLVKVSYKGMPYWGVASLGIAPTVRKDAQQLLEVYLLDFSETLYGETIEVIFLRYYRPEIKFETVEQLKNQMTKDILIAKHDIETLKDEDHVFD